MSAVFLTRGVTLFEAQGAEPTSALVRDRGPGSPSPSNPGPGEATKTAPCNSPLAGCLFISGSTRRLHDDFEPITRRDNAELVISLGQGRLTVRSRHVALGPPTRY